METYKDTNTNSTNVVKNLSHQIDSQFISSVDFNFKTGMPELDKTVNNLGLRFWQNVMLAVEANRMYYQCLAQIIDTRQFKDLKEVMDANFTLTLMKGEECELIGPELVAICKEHLKTFGTILDNKINEKPAANPLLTYHEKLNVLENELAENKKSMKIAENQIVLLKKEKKDLMNIISSFENSDVNKTSLEKRLKAEQKKNDELQAIVASVFNRRMHYYDSEEEY